MTKKPKLITNYKSSKHGNTTKLKRGKAAIDYIVVHYTGTMASARNNCIYFAREGAKTCASADFFVDCDGTIWQYNAFTCAYSWAVGDGGGKYGITNRNSVSIEVVCDDAHTFTKAQKAALKKLVNWLQGYCGVSDSHVVRHYDASRKSCPGPYAGAKTSKKGKNWVNLKTFITK